MLPDSDRTVRHCRRTSLTEDRTRITSAAFRLRADLKEKDLSVLWLEYFKCQTKRENLDCVRRDLRGSRYPKLGDLLGVIGVREAKNRISSDLGVMLLFRHTPSQFSEAHTSIEGLDCPVHEDIAEILAELANHETYPAILPPP